MKRSNGLPVGIRDGFDSLFQYFRPVRVNAWRIIPLVGYLHPDGYVVIMLMAYRPAIITSPLNAGGWKAERIHKGTAAGRPWHLWLPPSGDPRICPLARAVVHQNWGWWVCFFIAGVCLFDILPVMEMLVILAAGDENS